MQRLIKALHVLRAQKRWGVLALLTLLSPFALSGTESAQADPLAVVEGQSLDVRADHLDVDIAKGTAVLKGNVHAVLGELELECGKIDVRYDEAPVVRYARGSDDVTVRLKGIEAKAATLEVDVARRSVRLQGGVGGVGRQNGRGHAASLGGAPARVWQFSDMQAQRPSVVVAVQAVTAPQALDATVLLELLVSALPAPRLFGRQARGGGHVELGLAQGLVGREAAAGVTVGIHGRAQHGRAGIDDVQVAADEHAQQVLVVGAVDDLRELLGLQLADDRRAAQDADPQWPQFGQAQPVLAGERHQRVAHGHQRHQPLKTLFAVRRAGQREDAEVVAALGKLKSYLDYGTFQPIQIAATVAMNEAPDFPREVNAVYQGRRDALVDGLARAGWVIERPKGTMFAWAPIPEPYEELGSIDFAKLLVRDANVAVSPGVGFGEYGEGYVRIALVENEQRIRQAARNIRKFLAESAKSLHNVIPLASKATRTL